MINIKKVKKGQRIQFGEHSHCVVNDDLDCSNLIGKVVESSVSKDGFPHIIINLENKKYQEELEFFDIGKGKNNLIFNFPDDDFYNDVKVTVLRKEKKDD